MDPDPNLSKIINLLKKRGFGKEADVLEEFLVERPQQQALVTACPICGPTDPESDCVLCDGSGELVSVVPDDDEDARVVKELKLK